MNDGIVHAINSVVMEDDTLYHLGDWSFNGIGNIWDFRKRINCKNVHLILGNHDEHIKKNKEIKIPADERYLLEKLDILDDYTKHFEGFSHIKLKDLFNSVQLILELEIDKKLVILSHHPFDEWLEMDRKRSYHLHGHNHHRLDYTDLNMFYRRKDVGIDNNEFKVYSWNDIKELMIDMKIKIHNS
jgi:calcineurin-like phosphoesterase family protein